MIKKLFKFDVFFHENLVTIIIILKIRQLKEIIFTQYLDLIKINFFL